MGGEFLAVGSLEYRASDRRGRALARGASSTPARSATSIHEDDAFLRAAIGFGIRLKVAPLGDAPIAIDLAFPLRKEDEDETTLVSFSLSRDF